MFEPEIPCAVAQILLLCKYLVQKIEVSFGCVGKVNISTGEIEELEPLCQFLYFSDG